MYIFGILLLHFIAYGNWMIIKLTKTASARRNEHITSSYVSFITKYYNILALLNVLNFCTFLV